MQCTLGHIYIYVSDIQRSYGFYKRMLEYLGYKQSFKEDWGYAFENQGTSLWFEQTPAKHAHRQYHRRGTGLNHIAFKVESKAEVDKFHEEILTAYGLSPLYESPKPFPEYAPDYYAVYFEDPDRIKLEVASY